METYKVSPSTGMPGINEECLRIAELPEANHYLIDVSAAQHFEPIGMLLLGSALRNLHNRDGGRATVGIVGRDDKRSQGHSYAARMGFWWSIGLSSEPPAISSNPAGFSTIPISRLSYKDLFASSGGTDPVFSGALGSAAAEVATALCCSDAESPLWYALEYSLREVFRNVFEHSRADIIWYTAASRPSMDDVQIAILDEGVGIRRSLEDSGQYQFSSDLEAIECALRPGVSCNAKKRRSARELERLYEQYGQDWILWDNTGHGLTLATELCKHAGQYTVISGGASVSYSGALITSSASHAGTAVRLILQPSRVEDALAAAGLRPKEGQRGSSRSLLTESQRMKLRKKFGRTRE